MYKNITIEVIAMWEKELLRIKLKEQLKEKRYLHSLGVEETAVKLARRYGLDEKQAAVAALLHDWGRGLENDLLLKKAKEFGIVVEGIEEQAPHLLHGPVGAKLVELELGINDPAILQAIALHTTGGEGMSLLDKVIYLADYVEPGRIFSGVETVRKMAFLDLDKALLMAAENSLYHLLRKKALIHQKTVELRNALLIGQG